MCAHFKFKFEMFLFVKFVDDDCYRFDFCYCLLRTHTNSSDNQYITSIINVLDIHDILAVH